MQRGRDDRRRRQGGFTLVELGVVLAILAILVAIAVPTYITMVNRAREAEAQQAWSMVKTELWSYYVQYNQFPPSDDSGWWQGIDRPAEKPDGWKYSAAVTGNDTAQMNASGYGRTLCWSIDKSGTVKSGRVDGTGSCTPQ